MIKMKKKKNINKNNKESFFKRNYKLSWNYIKETRNFFYFSLFLIIFGILFGYFYPVFFHNFILKLLEDLVKQTQGFSVFEMIIFIFKNNLTSSFLAFVFGIILGIFPIISALFNGYVIGFVIKKASSSLGFSVLWNLVPHGIFEIPAIVLSIGLGIKIGFSVFNRDKKKSFVYNLENCLRIFIFIVVPLLIVAAVIEGFLILS